MKKYFTLEEAEALIPKVRGATKRLLKLKKAIALINSLEIDFEDYNYQHNLLSLGLNKKYHRLSYQFYKELEELEKTGCIVKDLDEGLVDFYSRHKCRDIFLCWRLGEQSIKYWHELECGFSGRKPIEELKAEKEQKSKEK